jgi:hypothetical protein
MLQQRVRVRAAAGLHRRHLARPVRVADVEDAHAAEALGADRRLHALHTAVQPATRLLRRHEQQVAMDGNVTLAARTDDGGAKLRAGRVRDVVDLDAVVVADVRVAAAERQVGVGERGVARVVGVMEAGRPRLRREQPHVADGRLRVVVTGAQADARVGGGCRASRRLVNG